MGIDNSAKLIFGAVIPYPTEFGIGGGDENEFVYPGLIIDHASPYYDCHAEDQVWFVSLTDSDELSLDELQAMDRAPYYEFCARFGLNLGEPKVMALPHIW
jgi:hypothetical protein